MRANGTEVEVVTGDIACADTAERLVPQRHHPPAAECGVCCTPPRWSRMRSWPTSPTSLSRSGLGAEGARCLASASGHHQAAAGLVLLVLVGGGAARFTRAGRAYRGDQHSWLDGFTQWRRAQGLPANAVAWAAWDQIGAGRHLADSGTTMIIPARRRVGMPFESLLRFDELAATRR